MRNAIITFVIVLLFTFFRCVWIIDAESTDVGIILVDSCFGPCELSKEKVLELFLYFVPCILFQMLQGVEIYKHYAIAGIYDIVRRTHRERWFFKEAVKLLLPAAICSICFVGLGVGLSFLFNTGTGLDNRVIEVMCMEIFIMTLYLFAVAVITNSLSMLWGSRYGSAITVFSQFILISALTLFGTGGGMDLYNHATDKEMASILLKLNPISHLLLDIHGSTGDGMESFLGNPYGLDFPLWESVVYVMILSIISLTASMFIAGRVEMLGGSKE